MSASRTDDIALAADPDAPELDDNITRIRLVQTDKGWHLESKGLNLNIVVPSMTLLQHWMNFLNDTGQLPNTFKWYHADRRDWRSQADKRMES